MTQLSNCQNCLKALADPTRIKMVELLATNSPMTVNAIVAHFKLRQPTISHHLQLLKEFDFVDSQKKGNQVYYSLNKTCKRDGNHDCMFLTTYHHAA